MSLGLCAGAEQGVLRQAPRGLLNSSLSIVQYSSNDSDHSSNSNIVVIMYNTPSAKRREDAPSKGLCR